MPSSFVGWTDTPEFRRQLLGYFSFSEWMKLRLLTHDWLAVIDTLFAREVESGTMIVHGGYNFSDEMIKVRRLGHRRVFATQVVFLLNTTKVGNLAFCGATNLVVLDIPEGVKSIEAEAFMCCHSLTTISFPTTLVLIANMAFFSCKSLENVDLLHTQLQELGYGAFGRCSELITMTIPDSLQTLGEVVFMECSKLVPSHIDVYETSDVVDHFRSLQSKMWIEEVD